MINVSEKICKKILPYVFYYGGASINKIWVLVTFSHPVLFSRSPCELHHLAIIIWFLQRSVVCLVVGFLNELDQKWGERFFQSQPKRSGYHNFPATSASPY